MEESRGETSGTGKDEYEKTAGSKYWEAIDQTVMEDPGLRLHN